MRLLGTLSTARLKTDRAFERPDPKVAPMMPPSRRLRDAPSNLPTGSAVWPMLFVLILIVLVFAGIRIAVDWPNVAAGIVPPEGSYERRFALHPILLYAHILPGVVYLVAPPSNSGPASGSNTSARTGGWVGSCCRLASSRGSSRSCSAFCSRSAACLRPVP
jgi:hypothetical protein